MNITEATLTDDQLDRAPSKAELDVQDELRRRLNARRPAAIEPQSWWNQDPWIAS